MATIPEARSKRNRFFREVSKFDNVVGTAVGYRKRGGVYTDEVVLKALVERKLPLDAVDFRSVIPASFEAVDTDVEEVGHIVAQQLLDDPRKRHRPILGGISIGHYMITAGTLGCFVTDTATGQRLMLSNNHVLANSNDAVIGDPIIQPGSADGGKRPADEVGKLHNFVPIDFGEEQPDCPFAKNVAAILNFFARAVGSEHRLSAHIERPQAVNQVDAAVASINPAIEFVDGIQNIGQVSSYVAPALGMKAYKSGRTTGFTEGTLVMIDATVKVDYRGKFATFEDQLVFTGMSAPGDSGSLICAKDPSGVYEALALLFAGSDQATIGPPIALALNALNVRLA